jgi:hypothetical protein
MQTRKKEKGIRKKKQETSNVELKGIWTVNCKLKTVNSRSAAFLKPSSATSDHSPVTSDQ